MNSDNSNTVLIEIKLYDPSRKEEWNSFVADSKNGTFLLDRNYMDYHSDRFNDSSMMIYRKNKLIALLPGNINGDTFYSHQGLTYGGLIMNRRLSSETCVNVMDEIQNFLRAKGVSKVVYKPIPHIYHSMPAEEDSYAIFKLNDNISVTKLISSTIYEGDKLKFTESRKSGVRKAVKYGIRFEESDDVQTFWNILNDNLIENHGVRPVHSAEEIMLLKSRFPERIKLFVVKNSYGVIVGGTLIYETPNVIHTQYISANQEGKDCGALDFLFYNLINYRYSKAKYIDFGHSTENNGKTLNNALIFQKEGFGGRGVCYEIFKYDL